MPTPEPDPTVVAPSVLAWRRARREPPVDETLRKRAEDAESRLVAMEAELAAARDEQAGLHGRLRAAEAEVAEQRRDGARELLRLRGALADAEARAAVLEQEVEELTRDLAAAAAHVPEPAAGGGAEAAAELARLREELRRRTAAEERLGAELAAERELVAEAAERIAAALRGLPSDGAAAAFAARPAGGHPALDVPAAPVAGGESLADDLARARERLQAGPAGRAAEEEDGTAGDDGVAEDGAPAAPEPVAGPDPDDTPIWLLTPPPASRDRSAVAALAVFALQAAAAAVPMAAVVVAVELAVR